MGIGFSQKAEIFIDGSVDNACLQNLTTLIHCQTDLNYSLEQTERGGILKPSFKNMPYRNSFVPEIDIVVSQNNEGTYMNMTGKPVKSVRVLMMFWFGLLAMMELFLLIIASISEFTELFPLFVPIVMCIFGYFLCKIATKLTFQKVVKAIQKK